MTNIPRGVFEVYKSENGEWYWRLKAPNFKIIAVGGEGFSSKQAALHGIYAVTKYVTKMVHGQKGQHPCVREIETDKRGYSIRVHDFPIPRRPDEVVLAKDDEPGAILVSSAALEFLQADNIEDATKIIKTTAKKKVVKKTAKKTAKKKVVKKTAKNRIPSSAETEIQSGGVLPDPLSTPEGRRVIGPGPDLPDNRIIGK